MQKLMWNNVLPLACMTADSLATAWHQHFHSFTTDCLYAYKSTQLAGLCAFGNVYSVLYSISLLGVKSGNDFYILYGSRLKREQQLKWPARNYLYCPSWDVFPVPPSCSHQRIPWGYKLGQKSKHPVVRCYHVIDWLSNSETSWYKRLGHLWKKKQTQK